MTRKEQPEPGTVKSLFAPYIDIAMAWLVFDIIGLLVYLHACCVWLIPWEQPAPTRAPLTVQEAR